MSRFRVPHVVLAILVVAVGFAAQTAWAGPQGTAADTVIIVDIADTIGSPGTGVPVSIYLQNLRDSIAGFMMSITLSRPDLMAFVADTTIDTCYNCIDSACTHIDTVQCTIVIVPSTTTGTLVHNWDYVAARTEGGTNLRLTGLADIDRNRSPLPILPYTNGVLIKVIAQVFCDIPDTLSSRTVVLQPNIVGTFFTDPKGDTISVAKLISGSITVPYTMKGDMNHDLNCDGYTTLQDVVLLINTAFRNGPQPGC